MTALASAAFLRHGAVLWLARKCFSDASRKARKLALLAVDVGQEVLASRRTKNSCVRSSASWASCPRRRTKA